jgi:hypothetical protein
MSDLTSPPSAKACYHAAKAAHQLREAALWAIGHAPEAQGALKTEIGDFIRGLPKAVNLLKSKAKFVVLVRSSHCGTPIPPRTAAAPGVASTEGEGSTAGISGGAGAVDQGEAAVAAGVRIEMHEGITASAKEVPAMGRSP